MARGRLPDAAERADGPDGGAGGQLPLFAETPPAAPTLPSAPAAAATAAPPGALAVAAAVGAAAPSPEVVELAGTGRLESVRLRDRASGEEQVVTPRAAFVFIGLDPNTEFLRGSVDLDARGFVDTRGGFTTSVPGVFAAGDVRRGSTKQLGSAVGDGIAALIAIREYLQEHHEVARHPED